MSVDPPPPTPLAENTAHSRRVSSARRLFRQLVRFWSTDHSLSALLVLLVLSVLLIGPLAELSRWGSATANLMFSLLLVAGVMAVSRRPLVLIWGAGLALASIISRWLGLFYPSAVLERINDGLSLISFAELTTLTLMQVLMRQGRVTVHRIQGAVAVYLLFGLMFSQAYQLLFAFIPNAFRISSEFTTSQLTAELTYFSFVTLTTVGYGDITAVHPLARSLAMLEALLGQLYPTILIARLVQLELETRPRNRS